MAFGARGFVFSNASKRYILSVDRVEIFASRRKKSKLAGSVRQTTDCSLLRPRQFYILASQPTPD